MNANDDLDFVRNDRIQFVTRRAPGERGAMPRRRVVIAGPPELLARAGAGRSQDLDALVELLKEPDRAWAAAVTLAAMTRHEEEIVNAYQPRPERWWTELGPTAHRRWSEWLRDVKHRLRWDSAEQVFVEGTAR